MGKGVSTTHRDSTRPPHVEPTGVRQCSTVEVPAGHTLHSQVTPLLILLLVGVLIGVSLDRPRGPI